MNTTFAATRWTLVVRSQGHDAAAKVALSDLCAAYYTPVIAFLRREGRTEDAARELAHGFFEKLLAGGSIEKAEACRGRFRSYLLGALKHYLSDQRDRSMTAKRGGHVEHLTWDTPSSTSAPGLQMADALATPPDQAFDRHWAISLLDYALQDLEAEMIADGKQTTFDLLKPWLTGDADAASQSSIADALGVSVDSVKTSVHRLRKRFRALMKKRIADTVEGAEQAEEELQHLMMALRNAR
jgi:DNA-directed RNA polymerase specialized sigma24 family protein